jgi:hypothetical protein
MAHRSDERCRGGELFLGKQKTHLPGRALVGFPPLAFVLAPLQDGSPNLWRIESVWVFDFVQGDYRGFLLPFFLSFLPFFFMFR